MSNSFFFFFPRPCKKPDRRSTSPRAMPVYPVIAHHHHHHHHHDYQHHHLPMKLISKQPTPTRASASWVTQKHTIGHFLHTCPCRAGHAATSPMVSFLFFFCSKTHISKSIRKVVAQTDHKLSPTDSATLHSSFRRYLDSTT